MRFLAAVLGALVLAAGPSAQSDLDAFMSRVLARRDENWKKLQQYILSEQERLQVIGPGGIPLYGFDRRYAWFIRDSIFVRSPLEADGVTIGEAERTRYEQDWLAREKRRERRAERAAQSADAEEGAKLTVSPRGVEVDGVVRTLEPRFVSAAYFLRFKFDPGHYALVGRDAWNGREVLKIEYYPSRLFTEGRTKPDKRARDHDDAVERKMNKVSMVTLWIDPGAHQILQYTFENVDMDFLPGRSIARVDELRASMKMDQPFPDVWLPADIEMRFALVTALGLLEARYDVRYFDYRLAEVSTRIKPPQ